MATKFGTKLAKVGLCKNFLEIFAPIEGVYGNGPSNAAIHIFPRPTPVAMTTKFGTKLAITRFV